MASGYDKALDLVKRMKNGDIKQESRKDNPNVISRKVRNTEDLSAMDEAVFGAYDASEDNKSEGLQTLRQRMEEVRTGNMSEETIQVIKENAQHSQLPKEILKSLIENPLIMDEKVVRDEKIVALGEKVAQKANAQRDIIKRVEENDRKKRGITENAKPTGENVASIDYGLIKSIIESVVDEKLSQMKGSMLNESRTASLPNIKGIQMINENTFWMLDTSDNIYECSMKYKGKNKRKN